MKKWNNYRCFSRTMAQYMESRGCELIDVYYSSINGRDVYEFDGSPKTWAIAQEYIASYKAYKAQQDI